MDPGAVSVVQPGKIADIFWKPLLPKVVILGLNSEENTEIRNLIAKAFENLFNVDFIDQVLIACQALIIM